MTKYLPACAAVLLGVAATLAVASAAASSPAGAPSVAATRIEAADAPRIDGDLSDPVWARAAIIGSFHQITPTPGAAPTERTEVRLLYDQYALFIAIHCYDDPRRIVATDKSHDGNAFSGDVVRINLDPLLTRRNGYGFDINPLGGYADGIIQDNDTFLKNWDLVWQAKARVVADGWTAELEIPFRELSYDPHDRVWGLQIIRQIKRNAEQDSWAPQSPSLKHDDLSVAGTLTGMQGLSDMRGLEIQVYGLSQVTHAWGAAGGTSVALRPSGNLYYKITPALTATLTANTDFSDAPLDQRRLNTTRFSLFTPETRQFFLQDATQFQFAGLAFTPPQSGGEVRRVTNHNGEPFFSRTIGIVNGMPVGILGGAKLSGEIGGLQVGALSVRTKDDQGVAAQTLSVERVAMPVLGSSALGLIATQGDPTGLSRNSLEGADFEYRNAHLGADQQLRADAFYEHSDSSLLGTDSAIGASVNLPNEPWSADVDFKQIGQNFAPALGFANRLGIRRYSAQVNRRTRPQHSYLQWYEFGASSIYIAGLDNGLQTRLAGAWVGLYNRSGDELDVRLIDHGENVPAAFELPDNVTVPAGRYRWQDLNVHLQSSSVRSWSVTFAGNCCRFYGGSYLDTDVTLDYRPNGTFEFQLEDHRLRLDQPDGATTVQALNGTVYVNFDPDMQLATQLQFDDISRGFDVLVRYNWQYRPGQYLLVAIGQDAQIGGALLAPRYVPHTADFLIRIGHTFLF